METIGVDSQAQVTIGASEPARRLIDQILAGLFRRNLANENRPGGRFSSGVWVLPSFWRGFRCWRLRENRQENRRRGSSWIHFSVPCTDESIWL